MSILLAALESPESIAGRHAQVESVLGLRGKRQIHHGVSSEQAFSISTTSGGLPSLSNSIRILVAEVKVRVEEMTAAGDEAYGGENDLRRRLRRDRCSQKEMRPCAMERVWDPEVTVGWSTTSRKERGLSEFRIR